MNIIISDESQFQQFEKSKIILSKYLQQINQRTFLGNISEGGLQELQKELLSIINKYNSIACYRVVTRNRIELLWIIGNKKNFDENGNFCFKKVGVLKQKKLNKMKLKNNNHFSFFENILEISALLHDIGKINTLFQNKLVKPNTIGFEPFRHDFISFIIVYIFFKNHDFNINNIFNNIDNVEEWQKIIKDGEIKIKQEIDNKCLSQWFFSLEKDSMVDKNICDIILWLILTHHKILTTDSLQQKENLFKLISLEDDIRLQNINFNTYKNESDIFNKEYEKQNFLFDKKKEENLFFKSDGFLQEIKKSFSALNDKKETLNYFSKNELFNIMFFKLRPILMTADFIGSNDKKDKIYINQSEKIFLANTDYSLNLDLTKKFGDSLTSHLMTVKNKTNIINDIINSKDSFKKIEFKEFDKEKKSIIFKNKEELPIKFQWQAQASVDIKNFLEQNNKDQPLDYFFGIVISETGSGKTLFAPRIIKDIYKNENIRYTLALGFRSLTLQTGQSYKENLLLNDKDLCVIIGDEISKNLFDLKSLENINNLEKEYEKNGSESLSINKNYITNQLERSYENENWYKNLFQDIEPEKINNIYNSNVKQIISSPIVVCTIDYLIRMVEQTKYQDIFSLFRNYSSDLILDEIDNYSPVDLISIAKLCYLVGLAGRKLIIMSATISQEISTSLYSSYKEGVKLHQKINKKDSCLTIGFFSNLSVTKENNNLNNEIYQHSFNKEDDFELKYQNYTCQFHEKLTQKESKQKIEFLNIWEKNNEEEINIFEKIYEKCKTMHDNNHNIVSYNGEDYFYSFGFAKFNTTKKAINFTNFLLNQEHKENNLIYFTQCYHSKMPIITINYIEDNLNFYLKRNNEENLKKLVIDKIKKLNIKEKNILFIVSTTSIQEVGRDHDYDYCILEPFSLKAIIQAAGRVKRHRDYNPSSTPQANVCVLSSPIVFEKENLWKNPGFENYGFLLYQTKNSLKEQFNNYYKKNNYNIEVSHFKNHIIDNLQKNYSNNHNIYTSICLTEPNILLKNVEDLSYKLSLKSSKISFTEFKDTIKLKSSLSHVNSTKFRSNNIENIEVSIVMTEQFFTTYSSHPSKIKNLEDIKNNLEEVSLDVEKKLIFPIDKNILIEKSKEILKKISIREDIEFQKNLFSASIEKKEKFTLKYKHYLGYYY